MSGARRASSADSAPQALAMRHHFMNWQCRLRQYAVRQEGGRPGPGMRPTIALADENESLGPITVLIVRREPESITAEFRHMYQRTLDPASRYASAIEYLSAAYYQQPERFDDEMTALFGPGSEIPSILAARGRCRLDFQQYGQRYELQCTVRRMTETEPAFQATFWHNSLFNPELPGNVSVLGFTPDWVTGVANPPLA